MTMQARQNQLKQAEIQGNKAKIVQGETESRKMTMQSKKQIQNQAQAGRSMVEMLGVLAIIAILSIGGIVGYRLAMNYYQANQIAHEMNMMRTDAQIKIAQGTENLTLGSPYDENKISFNNYDTAFGCKYVDENDLISEETVSCQIANAYFIELPKIPNGVCQPLIRLINGMDNLIAFSVNDSEYEEGGTCQEGENDLYAVFSGETVSDLTHCERDDDCKELESTPVCDLSRHVCVECTQKEDCTQGNGGICIENKCDYCADGEVRDESSQCVECLTYENCTDTPETPQCDEISHTCKSCAEIDANKPLWADNECKECPADQPWNGESCGCKDNNLCFTTFGDDYYCHKTKIDDYTDGETGFCKQFNFPLHKKLSDGAEVWAVTGTGYTYWNTCRLCEARAGKDGTHCSENGYQSSNMLDMAFFQCADQNQMIQVLKNNKFAYCHKTSGDIEQYKEDNIAPRAQEIQELITLAGVWVTDSVFDMRPIRIDLSARIVGRVGSCLYGHEDADGNHFPVCR